MKRFFCILGLLSCLGLCMKAQSSSTTEDLDAQYAVNLLKKGEKAPDFSIPTPDGKTLKLSQFKGKYVVLDFWASWCKDCRKDLPNIKAAYERFSKAGVQFIGISFDEEKEKWEGAIKEFSLKYPQGSELKKWRRTDISPLYKIDWIPTVYLIDKKGNVILGTVQSEKIVKKLAELTGK